jgi:maltose alpha-D-glucosyltransferase/alpha-amylase
MPVIQSLNFGYKGINVEAQLASAGSLLHWTRGMLATRREHPVFGLGEFRPLEADNESVLAFLRALPEGMEAPGAPLVCCLHNLSPDARAATVSLGQYPGWTLTDLRGGARLGKVDADGQFTCTLTGHGYLWLRLEPVRSMA